MKNYLTLILAILSLSTVHASIDYKLEIGQNATRVIRNGDNNYCSFPDSPYVKKFVTKEIQTGSYEIVKILMSKKGSRINPVVHYLFIGENNTIDPGNKGTIYRVFKNSTKNDSFPLYFYLATSTNYTRDSHFFANEINPATGDPIITRNVTFNATVGDVYLTPNTVLCGYLD